MFVISETRFCNDNSYNVIGVDCNNGFDFNSVVEKSLVFTNTTVISTVIVIRKVLH